MYKKRIKKWNASPNIISHRSIRNWTWTTQKEHTHFCLDEKKTNKQNDREKTTHTHTCMKYKKKILCRLDWVWKNVYYQHRGWSVFGSFAFPVSSPPHPIPFPDQMLNQQPFACWNKWWARLWVCVAEIIPISFLTLVISYMSIGFGYINICYDKNGHNR